jgi:hypothetical protein
VAFIAVAHAAYNESDWINVPGGYLMHKSCVHEVPDGVVVDVGSNDPCKYPARRPNAQIYAIDTHWTPSGTLMTGFNSTFICPGMPPQAGGQINYFWPGFKSTAPTMGLPVIQPVLQYGTGNNWVIRSWYVFGNQGESQVSTPVPVSPGDSLYTYMDYDGGSQTWTIYSKNMKSGRDTTLRITKAKMHNVDYKVAMLVLETIMPGGNCKLYASGGGITFTGNKVNGQTIQWTPRTQMQDCQQKIDLSGQSSGTVKFTWTN